MEEILLSQVLASQMGANLKVFLPIKSRLLKSHSYIKQFFKNVFTDFIEREEGEERKKNIYLLFHLLMSSLVDSFMCLAWGLNLQLTYVLML